MSKSQSKQVDVLVLGRHPAAYLAAGLLKNDAKLRIVHAPLANEPDLDRLVLVNPRWFSLAKPLEGLRRSLNLTAVYGTWFLGDAKESQSEFRSKTAVACIADLAEVRTALQKFAKAQGVEMVESADWVLHHLDEQGASVTLDSTPMHPRALVLAGPATPEQAKLIGLSDAWDRDVLHRYTFVRLPNPNGLDLGARPIMPMSLDLKGKLYWAWLLPGDGEIQLAVEQPMESVAAQPADDLLAHWVKVLKTHGILPSDSKVPLGKARSLDLPLAGALAQEGVANRTLIVGPEGGFFSACAEDLYPTCWSAIYAADVLKKALKETHLQDALQAFRHKWRTTLGDYLRGPQQNLRFLLPLVYRNPVMTARLAESILEGKGVVR
jgi:hypothetical protein